MELGAALAGRYAIVRELGAGGMATVYVADDLRHHRRVAIKVLGADLAASLGAERFLREIQTTANLRHPNILPLFDSGQAGSFLFYVMPLVEGASLRDRLAHETRLSLDQALRITREAADALAYAHAHGVIHRDVKPDNILLDGGHAVVADFGIARGNRNDGAGTLTSVGASIGTPAYMSPEQAAGDPDLDGRSDQYALACVLQEMLTGQPPFTGASAASVIRQHMVADPPAIAELRPDVPQQVSAAVRRALSKEPANRFDSVADFAAALDLLPSGMHSAAIAAPVASRPRPRPRNRRRVAAAGMTALLALAAATWWANGGVAPDDSGVTASSVDGIPDIATDPSIAVLPFMDLSADRSQEYFADGVSVELLNLLSRVPGLRVIARTSSFSFRGRDVPIPEMARVLRVAAFLEGSVRQAGDRVRIDVRLVRATDGSQLWAESYDRTLDNIFEVQDEIAARVVGELRVTLLEPAPRARTIDPQAYAQLLKGQYLNAQGTAESRRRALEHFQQALAFDSKATRAWTGIAGVYISQSGSGERPEAEGLRLARAAVDSALLADPDDALTLSLLGWMEMTYDDDLASAARHFQRALSLEPANPSVLGNAAMFVQNLDRQDEAIAAMRYQAERDPANPRVPFNLASTYLYAGRWTEAAAAARTVLAMSPGRTTIRATLAHALLEQGQREEALAAALAEPSERSRLPVLAMVYHALRRTVAADSVTAEFRSRFGTDAPYAVAAIFASQGQADSAFHWLARARNDDNIGIVSFDPVFTRLHRDPRWIPFLRQVGKAPDQLAAISFKLAVPD